MTAGYRIADRIVRIGAGCWVRGGEKADMFNLGVIARDPAYLPYLSRALTVERVADWFGHLTEGGAPPQVVRHDAPGFHCLNFTVAAALGGGQTSGMRLDPNAKGMAQQLLTIPVAVPAALASEARANLGRLGHTVPELA